MSIKDKKILSIISYYTLFILAIIMATLTILYAINRDVPIWATIVYVIWACAVIAVLVYDIFCTSVNRMKFIPGIIIYVLSIASVIVTAILYLVNAGLTVGLTAEFMPIYTGLAALVMSTTLYMIASYIVGESVVEHNTAMESIKQNSNN